jgi:type IV pilus assembly protein PilA
MSGRKTPRFGDEGFTLVEILVAILLIGVLAAIAIPTFLGQTSKATDASAEAAATNLRKYVSYCYLSTNDYSQCSSPAQVPDTGLRWGSGPGTVAVAYQPYGLTDYVAFEAVADDGTIFAVVKSLSQGTTQRLCVSANARYPSGSCRSGGSLAGFPVGQW